jgi:hypothetical protein
MTVPPMRLRLWLGLPLAVIINAALAVPASAHVKWFAEYDVAGKPLNLARVLSPDFEFLTGLSMLVLLMGALIEWNHLGSACMRAFDRVTWVVENNTELLFRVGCAFFFVSIWSIGGILLTPELKTESFAVSVLQLGIAAGMLRRQTMALSGFGIFVLYAIGIWTYGLFHMADYPIFLGIAIYFVLIGLQRNLFGIRPLDIVRWSAGITLMWASIEKWAYPEWTHPLFVENPYLSMGFKPDFFMQAAGAVEFALAFALMWTPLVRRLAATLLLTMFVGAIFDFGQIDLIGHSMIIVVLLAIMADRDRQSGVIRYPWLLPVGYASSLTVFVLSYYLAHAALYRSSFL